MAKAKPAKAQAKAQDPVQADPKHYTVEFDNDRVGCSLSTTDLARSP